ncbi:hypothetical protein AT05_07510 [Schleiferia thermophila str. Yellowstone]|nr:hypothetical protein AT05_07510 [Schleiferia thermophila str. Yellowstone]
MFSLFLQLMPLCLIFVVSWINRCQYVVFFIEIGKILGKIVWESGWALGLTGRE